MTKKASSVPPFRVHKATGQGYVNLDGRRVYLGRADTLEAKQRYARLLAEWTNGTYGAAVPTDLSVAEMAARYWRTVEARYPAKTATGKPAGEAWLFKSAIDSLVELYGDLPVSDFGPLKFRAVRSRFVQRGVSRGTVNKMAAVVVRAFTWAVNQELAPASVTEALRTVHNLRRGETTAPDHARVKPVPTAHVEAIREHVSPHVWAMIELQLLTAARPGELLAMRPVDIDMGGKVWAYRPRHHKTLHHDCDRVIYIGERGQQVIRPFLAGSPVDAILFPYKVASYRRSIARACQDANVPTWHPHQLRHNAGTTLRKEFGLEMARIILGHGSTAMTERYAEVDHAKAVEVMQKIG